MGDVKITTSRNLKNASVVWAGGNPRTGQRKTFLLYDNIKKTRHILDVHEKEAQAKQEATVAPDGDANRLNPEQQMGRVLHANEVMRRLKLMNPSLIFEPSIACPDRMNIYTEAKANDIKTGLPGIFKKQAAAMPIGDMPEFSIMDARYEEKPTEDGEMKAGIKHGFEKQRGWRTVLTKLYVSGLITETQIEKHFQISQGRSSQLWQKQIHSPIHV